MSLLHLLVMRCTIRRWETRTPNALGVIADSDFDDVATGVPCLVQHHAVRYLRGEGGIDIKYTATAFFEFSANIRPKSTQTQQSDQIVLTSGGSGTYQTRGVVDEAGMQNHLAVACEAV